MRTGSDGFSAPDLHGATPLFDFVESGSSVSGQRSRFARIESIKQKFAPNFTTKKLGNPDILLLSAGSLPSLIHLPGLEAFLSESKVPYVVLCQFNADLLPISTGERLRIQKLLLGSKANAFVSQHNLNLAQRQCGKLLKNCFVIHNPIRSQISTPIPSPSISERAIQFASVARMDVLWKGQDLLLEILSSQNWKSRNWHLNLYGSGPDREHLESWAKELNLEKRVSFHGYVRSLEEIWKDSDIMLLPSRGEGLPLAILEAMMYGRPVVTTDVGGNSEIVRDNETGFLADAATVKSFGSALERAWVASNSWPQMGHKAHLDAKKIASQSPAEALFRVLSNAVKE